MSWDKRKEDEEDSGVNNNNDNGEEDNEDFWWRRKKRRIGDDFDELFGFEFDKEFERMRRHIDKLVSDMMRGNLERMESPFVYGFSMRIGPDGKPQIQEFGNTPKKGTVELSEREPLTDVFETEDAVSITVELPGVEKEDINLTATEDTVVIDVHTPKRKYHKALPMPCKISPGTTDATYKNGVLDIVIKRADEKKKKPGKKIEIK